MCAPCEHAEQRVHLPLECGVANAVPGRVLCVLTVADAQLVAEARVATVLRPGCAWNEDGYG